MTYFVALVCGFVLDFCFAWYTRSVGLGKVWAASVASVCCAVPSLTGVALVVSDWRHGVFYAVGLFLGTLVYMLGYKEAK